MNTHRYAVLLVSLALGFGFVGGICRAQDTLYWADPYDGVIQRMDVCSGTIETVLATTLRLPEELAVDPIAGKMYWIDFVRDVIQRASLDGTLVEDLSFGVDVSYRGGSLALDALNGRLYFSTRNVIHRCSLDGSECRTVVEDHQITEGVRDLAISLQEEKIYWVDGLSLVRSNLEGAGVEVLAESLEASTGVGWGGNPITGPVNQFSLDVDAGMIYWSDQGGIHRSWFDGSNHEIIYPRKDHERAPAYLAIDPEEEELYWESSRLGVRRADLDGSDVEDLVPGFSESGGIALVGEHLYWVDRLAGVIRRSERDGSNRETLIESPVVYPAYLAVDPEEGRLYWTEPMSYRVRRARLDGSEIETLVDTWRYLSPSGVTLDLQNRRLYWSAWDGWDTRYGGGVFRAHLDGSAVDTLLGAAPFDIELDVAHDRMYLSTQSFLSREAGTRTIWQGIVRVGLDGDSPVEFLHVPEPVDLREIRVEDVMALAVDSLSQALYWTFRGTVGRTNLDGTGTVDLGCGQPDTWQAGLVLNSAADLMYWAANESSVDAVHHSDFSDRVLQGHTPSSRIMQARRDGSDVTTLATLPGTWIRDMVLLPGPTSTATESVQTLPNAHVLFPAYPNPFNPTVTLSYALASTTQVRLQVFDVLGREIATLVDEHQVAGRRSVTWNGLDRSGAPVPSGTYLYRLRAGNYSATKAMVLLR